MYTNLSIQLDVIRLSLVYTNNADLLTKENNSNGYCIVNVTNQKFSESAYSLKLVLYWLNPKQEINCLDC